MKSLARPKRFELLTPRFVVKSRPLKSQELFANYVKLVTCDDNGLHPVCKPFRPIQARCHLAQGQREFKPHRATPRRRRLRDSNITTRTYRRVHEGCSARNAESTYHCVAHRTAPSGYFKACVVIIRRAIDNAAERQSVPSWHTGCAHIHPMYCCAMQN